MNVLLPRLLGALILLWTVGMLWPESQPQKVATSVEVRASPIEALPLQGRVLRRVSEIDGQDIPYLVFVPPGYDPEVGEWPILLGLHGTAGAPDQILQIPQLTALAERYGFLVVCPSSSGWYGRTFFLKEPRPLSVRSDLHVADVLARVHEEFRVDSERMYLLGVSKGGAGAWHLALKNPERWSGVGLISPAGYQGTADLGPIEHLSVIMVQGAEDNAVSVPENRRIADAMKRRGMNYRYLEIPDAGHDLFAYDVAGEVFSFFEESASRFAYPRR